MQPARLQLLSFSSQRFSDVSLEPQLVYDVLIELLFKDPDSPLSMLGPPNPPPLDDRHFVVLDVATGYRSFFPG